MLEEGGAASGGALILDGTRPDGWVLLRSGTIAVANCIVGVRGAGEGVVISLALDRQGEQELGAAPAVGMGQD